jgi:hypothetical protein
MSVTDGQLVNAAITNAAFVSKTASSGNSVTGIISLNNTNSASVADLQAEINAAKTAYMTTTQQNVNNRLSLSADVGHVVVPTVSTGGQVNLNDSPFLKVEGASSLTDTWTIPFKVTLYGTSDTNYLTLKYADIAGSCLLNGDFDLKNGHSITVFFSTSLNRFIEVCRNV